ncbi:hypothetical protein ACFFT4_23455 [Cohnella cellulosilytica]|uniref:hypothetical protein n=1 Tax=Cohnella cellulosilytica TaxID=986710 RepID=UPI0035EFA4B8
MVDQRAGFAGAGRGREEHGIDRLYESSGHGTTATPEMIADWEELYPACRFSVTVRARIDPTNFTV